MTKKCWSCGRRMARHECGELLTVEVTEEPLLVVDGSQARFEVDIRFENGDEHYAIYDEVNLRWESGDATYRSGELL